jgi:hypothetical protein
MLRMTTLSWAPRTPRLVLVLAFGLAACGGDDDTGDDANDSAPTASDPTNDSSSATADDDATVDASADDDATMDASADDDGSSGGTSTDASDTVASQTMSDGTMTTTMDTGESSTGGGGIDECSESDPMCSDGQMCRASKCCPDAGFCVFAAAPTCGGFVGEPCPEGLVCVLDQCVADGQGRCVDSDTATAIQEAQPGCWTAG